MRETLEREAFLEALVSPGSVWSGVEVYPSLDSTNAEAARVGRPWYVVVTDHQQAGRGRMGRTWETPAGTSLTMSALVPAPPEGAGWVPLLAGLAVQRGIADVTGLTSGLKWPNDVLLDSDDDRKVSGLLCELVAAGVVVGIGVNVDQDRGELPVDTATSLRLGGASAVSRLDLAVAVLGHLATLHAALVEGGAQAEAVRTAYRDSCRTIGQEVELHLGDGVRRATAQAVDDEGRLVVTGEAGPYAVAAGDVVHVRSAPQE